MNRNFKTSSLTEAAMMTGILVILAYLSTFLSILTFFFPVPAIILAKRKGLKYAGLSLVAADIIISMILGIQTGIIFLILLTPLAVAVSYGICKDMDPSKVILIGSVAFMVSSVVMILIMQAVLEINFIHSLVDMYNQSFDMMEKMMKNNNIFNNGVNNGTDSYLSDYRSMLTYLITNLFPALIIILSIIMSAINYFIVSKFAGRFSVEIRQPVSISYFSFPRTFIVAMAVLLLISYLLSFFNANVHVIQLNIFMISYIAMILQGFAVLKFFVIKLNISRVFKTIILLFAILNAYLVQILAVVGIADLILNFRKIGH